LVIALSGAPVDLVVATDISASFLQVTPDPWFVFRVYEKIVLRIKQPEAIVRLQSTDRRVMNVAIPSDRRKLQQPAAASPVLGDY
jgi:hypothetical protein